MGREGAAGVAAALLGVVCPQMLLFFFLLLEGDGFLRRLFGYLWYLCVLVVSTPVCSGKARERLRAGTVKHSAAMVY